LRGDADGSGATYLGEEEWRRRDSGRTKISEADRHSSGNRRVAFVTRKVPRQVVAAAPLAQNLALQLALADAFAGINI